MVSIGTWPFARRSREVQNFAEKRLVTVHDDLKWRHVGLYRDESSVLCAVFFDLARMKEDVQMKEAVQRMSDALFKKCDDGECDGCKSAST